MNRIVIVGNGFDLAHDLKTGYNDFMRWYLKKCLEAAYINEDTVYEDNAIKVVANTNIPVVIQDHEGYSNFVDFIYENGALRHLMSVYGFSNSDFPEYKSPFKVTAKSPFIRQIIANCSINQWVDIENEYYSTLMSVLKGDKSLENQEESVSDLNASMEEIIKQLEHYLNSLPSPFSNHEYTRILNSHIKASDVLKSPYEGTFAPDNTLILNFNYTSTITPYVIDSEVQINYIHGRLKDRNNRLVFGFGDELDNNYKVIEQNNAKGKFTYIKSFWYFKTQNYRQLIRFIESDDYQVVVLGHSCGLSDRTMLNMIFEDSNCKSIKIYHYVSSDGNNNYTDLTHEISRHFNNKQEMRRKIVPFSEEDFMPQSSKKDPTAI